MASKKQESNTDGNSDLFSNSTDTDGNDPALNETGKSETARDLTLLIRTDDMLVVLGVAENEPLCQLCKKFDIQPTMSKHFLKLKPFEIVMVLDDSGSMITPVVGDQGTRWNELCAFVKMVHTVAMTFHSNGIDIHFLNRKPIRKVKNPADIDQAFATPPSGHTPLVPTLDQIFESHSRRQERDKKLLVFVATDGEPTDKDGKSNVPELVRLMQEKRQIDTTYVSFLLCTDDSACVNYLHDWDRTMRNVDVTDNFLREREKIRRHRGQDYHFSYGDYVVKALVGAIVPEIRCSQ